MWVIGISRARLTCTSPGLRPTAVAAWATAARAPQPIPTRYSVQKTLPLSGRRLRNIPFIQPLLEIHHELQRDLLTRRVPLRDGHPDRRVREHVTVGEIEPVLEPDIDPIER